MDVTNKVIYTPFSNNSILHYATNNYRIMNQFKKQININFETL